MSILLIGIARWSDWEEAELFPLTVERMGEICAVLAFRQPEDGPRAHHAHVVRACRQGPLLPARTDEPWGPAQWSHWGDESRRRRALSGLAAIEGCIEITLEMTQTLPPKPVSGASDGRTYLRDLHRAEQARAALEDKLTRAARQMVSVCGGRIRADVEQAQTNETQCRLTLALLVRRADAAELVLQLDNLAMSLAPKAVTRIDGPWPPYHFAAMAAGDAAQVLAA
jgi:hypothetical protein